MRWSLKRKLGLWHTGLFAAAILARLALDWQDIRTAATGGSGMQWTRVAENLLASLIPLIVLAVVTRWLILRAVQRITILTEGAERIQEDSLHQQLPVTGSGDELDRLTVVLNEMTARLAASFQRIREFTLHASHELKTPLTILRSGFERALTRPLSEQERSEQLVSWMDEVERLTRIVSGLTFLTQADGRQITMAREPLELEELLEDAGADAEILGQPQGITTTLEIRSPARISGHRHRLRQVFLNLTDNAVKYNDPGGRIRITLDSENEWAVVRISNTGAGIPPAETPHIFERFYRSESARGSQEGCGLGLCIAHWIVEAHHGRLTAESTEKWTTLTVRLPLVLENGA